MFCFVILTPFVGPFRIALWLFIKGMEQVAIGLNEYLFELWEKKREEWAKQFNIGQYMIQLFVFTILITEKNNKSG